MTEALGSPELPNLLLGNTPIAQVADDIRTTTEAFTEIYLAFLVLGTLVGIVVIAYTIWNTYKYWEVNEDIERDVDDVVVGELPSGPTSGKKLFLSFSISAVIVLSLIGWTYLTLLYYDAGPDVSEQDEMEIEVVGYQFGWNFEYEDGFTETNTLVVPEDTVVHLRVTSRDVFHNLGIPEYRVKTDAIPGRYTDMWFVADETGEYHLACYELCGTGHSLMTGEVHVMEQEEFDEWYSEQVNEEA